GSLRSRSQWWSLPEPPLDSSCPLQSHSTSLAPTKRLAVEVSTAGCRSAAPQTEFPESCRMTRCQPPARRRWPPPQSTMGLESRSAGSKRMQLPLRPSRAPRLSTGSTYVPPSMVDCRPTMETDRREVLGELLDFSCFNRLRTTCPVDPGAVPSSSALARI